MKPLSSDAKKDCIRIVLGARAILLPRLIMPQLPCNQHLRIKHLHQEGCTTAYIAGRIGCTKKTVRKWINRFAQNDSACPRKSSGRPSIVSAECQKRIVEMLLSGEYGGSRHVAREIHREGFTDRLIGASTVLRAAHKHSSEDGDPLVCRRGRPGKWLTGLNKEQRIKFARAHRRTSWSHVMITDRCKFHFRYPGVAVRPARWFKKSKQHEDVAFKPNHPDCYNVYGGITRHGVTRLHPVTGTSKLHTDYKNLQGQKSRNITKAEYTDVVRNTLLPEGRRIFSAAGISHWKLQQDGDPTHSCAGELVQQFNRQRGVGTVEMLGKWPGNSPDLSPIENVWGMVQREVDAKGCKTFDEFKAEVNRAFQNIKPTTLKHLFDSIQKRLELCIEKEGARTGY